MSDHRQPTLQPSLSSARIAGEVGMVEEGIMGPTTLNNSIAMVGIDHDRSRYPFCVVWSPLPPITWAIPFIGHMGIADSRGVIYDFAGPYTIGEDKMAFGKPTRYLRLDPGRCTAEHWDEAVARASETYSKRMHNLCCDNCHSHVALALRRMAFAGTKSWNMVALCFWVFIAGKYVSFWGAVKQWGPFCVALILYFSLR